MTETKRGMSRAKTKLPSKPTPKGWKLETPPDPPGKTRDQFMAKVAADGLVGNARAVVSFGEPTFGELSLTDCAVVLGETAQGLNRGDLSGAVTLLAAQAVALNVMFGELARRAGLNMGQHLGAAETYMRLALKAQGQSRATLETLAAIKNPPVVFARQANINNGGQQQVNNGTANSDVSTPVAPGNRAGTGRDDADMRPGAVRASAGAHAGETQSEPSKLLEGTDGERLDTRAQGAAGAAHQSMETVGALNRAADPGR